MPNPCRPAPRAVILVVEDEPLIRIATAASLNDAGYDVVEASDAEQAIEHLQGAKRVAAIVTDIDLPGHVNGLGLAWRAHSLNTASVLLSGRVIPPVDLMPPRAKFLAKPVMDEEVVAAVRSVLAGRGDAPP